MAQPKATRSRKARAKGKSIPAPAKAAPTAGQAIPLRYLRLPLGQIRPEGWMLAQMTRDLTSGYAACLDELAPPEYFRDVFGKDRKYGKSEDLQPSEVGPKRWWWRGSGATMWWDGLIRAAFLAGHEPAIAKVRRYVNNVLKYQERDGYLGIYNKEARFRCDHDDGELWSQSRIMVALLAYHELTGDAKVLEAVGRGADLTIGQFGPDHSYFQGRKGKGGVTHGLMFMDVMEWLHQLTAQERYVRFGEFLYNDYSLGEEISNKDNQIDSLLSDRPLWGHMPHITSQLRTHLWLHYVTGREIYKRCYEAGFAKARKHMVPSGSLIGSEQVEERLPTGNMPYEYCGFTELLTSLHSLVRKMGPGPAREGEMPYADWVENLVFNAGQGARLADGGGVSYLTTDDRLRAHAAFHGGRGKYSPAHNALCCDASAVKLLPYHVGQMWLRLAGNEPGLAAMYYGPCRVNTHLGATPVTIIESTHYPFEEKILFDIRPAEPVEFTLQFRIPSWASKAVLSVGDVHIVQNEGMITVRRVWRRGDQVTLAFDAPVRTRKVCDAETFITRGPLIYAVRIADKKVVTKKYPGGLADYDILPKDGQAERNWEVFVPAPFLPTGFMVERHPVNMDFPWDEPPLVLRGELLDGQGRKTALTLMPMGCTVLRRVTFPFMN